MKKKEFLVKDEGELVAVAQYILDLSVSQQVFLLVGDMGVGKTTLVKTIGKLLGIEDQVSSPTYSIVNEYKTDKHDWYHFDLYRLQEEELYDIGFEDYFSSEARLLIEWPQVGQDFYDDQAVKVEIRLEGLARIITVEYPQ